MLDRSLYRAAFIPVFLGVLIAAFALSDRPRAIGTTLAPDAFDGERAMSVLTELRRTFPNRRPGSAGDDALARRVERELRAAFTPGTVRVLRTEAETIDGEATLTSIVGERVGRANRRLVVVANRDAAEPGSAAQLSGTAALIELARVFQGRALRRTITLISTSGGTGGHAGLRAALRSLSGRVDAVLILGDVAGDETRRPMVVPWSETSGAAPLRLRRTVEEALRRETDLDPGSPRALTQLARLAIPMTLTPQGAAGAGGLSAVTVQASGERGPPADTEVSGARMQAFGRGVLRSISALDNGPDVPSGPRQYLVIQRRALPTWAAAMVGALLLLPALIGAIDGLARVRRRRQPVAIWLRWLLAAAAPFLLAAIAARLLGLVGAVPSLRGVADPSAADIELAGLGTVGLFLVGGFALRRRIGGLLGVPPRPRDAGAYPSGAAAAIALTLAFLGVAVWVVNPYTALLLIPAIHLWLLAVVPEVQLRRPVLLGMVLAGFLPFALAALYYAAQFGADPLELAWLAVLVLAGGHAAPLGVIAWSLVLACAVGSFSIAARKRRRAAPGEPDEPDVTTRGPLSYAGPGSLGGTESAIRGFASHPRKLG